MFVVRGVVACVVLLVLLLLLCYFCWYNKRGNWYKPTNEEVLYTLLLFFATDVVGLFYILIFSILNIKIPIKEFSWFNFFLFYINKIFISCLSNYCFMNVIYSNIYISTWIYFRVKILFHFLCILETNKIPANYYLYYVQFKYI